VLVEALEEIVAPGGLVGALKEVVLDLRIVAPDALVIGSCPNRAHALSGWQPAVGKAIEVLKTVFSIISGGSDGSRRMLLSNPSIAVCGRNPESTHPYERSM
jgi:hypothetical protein